MKYNPELCQERFIPCSTFKIANALIGLDLGILKDENTKFQWDGKKQPFKQWERDHTLTSAVRNSVVWYFQKLALQIGTENYRKYLSKLNYGNHQVPETIDYFWLREKSLLISPQEQISFLNDLYRNELPVSQHAMETVRKILVLETTTKMILSGKTGSRLKNGQYHLGWFVGAFQTGGKTYTFASCIRGDGVSGADAKTITKEILNNLKLEKGHEMKILFGEFDISNRLITATNLAFAFPAQMPILPGHILVCPRRIVEKFEDLTTEEAHALFALVTDIKKVLAKEFGATGFNIAWNEGNIAGQSVPHLHVHIVPRKHNDKGITDYEPRKFLYRPGVRDISPDEELEDVAKLLTRYFSTEEI